MAYKLSGQDLRERDELGTPAGARSEVQVHPDPLEQKKGRY